MRFTRSVARSATLFFAFVCSLASAEDLYDILGIDESATDREIKNACVNEQFQENPRSLPLQV